MTRVAFTFIVWLSMSMAAVALEAEVDALRSALSSNDSNQINNALIQLNGGIGKYEAVDRSSWDKPSPKRVQHRHDIMAVLGPVTGDLVRLTKDTNPTLAQNASVILGYSGGSNEVYGALKANLQQSTNAGITSAALYSLYQMGKADNEVRTIAADRIAGYADRGQSDVAFRLLNLGAVWLLPEALPICVEMLRSDMPVGSKVVAAQALMKMGPAAAEAFPELQGLLDQLRTQGADFREVNALERAVRAVSGQTQPREPASSMALATPVSSMPDPTAVPIASPAPTTPVAQTPALTAEHQAPVWPWLVGIAALTVIALLVWKRRA